MYIKLDNNNNHWYSWETLGRELLPFLGGRGSGLRLSRLFLRKDIRDWLVKLNFMEEKIKTWKLFVEPKLDVKVAVEFNQYDLAILVTALRSAEYEGAISTEEMDCMFEKINIED